MANKLTHKQELFVNAYLGEAKGNATEAARLAGYKGNDGTLRNVGCENLTNPNIAELIEKRTSEAAMSATEVLKELSDIAGADWREYLQIKYNREGEPVDAMIILKDKIRALELLGKYHKLFTEKQEHSGAIEVIVKREQRTGTTKTD